MEKKRKVNGSKNHFSVEESSKDFREVKQFTKREKKNRIKAATPSYTSSHTIPTHTTFESNVSKTDDLERNLKSCQVRSDARSDQFLPSLDVLGSHEPPVDPGTDNEILAAITDGTNISGIQDLDDDTLLTDFLYNDMEDEIDNEDENEEKDNRVATTDTIPEVMFLESDKSDLVFERRNHHDLERVKRHKIHSLSQHSLRDYRRINESCCNAKLSSSASCCCTSMGVEWFPASKPMMLKQCANNSKDDLFAHDGCFSRWSKCSTKELPDFSKRPEQVHLHKGRVCSKKRWFLINNKICSLEEADRVFRSGETIDSLRKQIEIYKQIIEYMEFMYTVPDFRPRICSKKECETKVKESCRPSKMNYFTYSEIYNKTVQHISSHKPLMQDLNVEKKFEKMSKDKTEKKEIFPKKLKSPCECKLKHGEIYCNSDATFSESGNKKCIRVKGPRRRNKMYFRDRSWGCGPFDRYIPSHRDAEYSISFQDRIRSRSPSRRYAEDRLPEHQSYSHSSNWRYRSDSCVNMYIPTKRLSQAGVKEDLREKIKYGRSRQSFFPDKHAKKRRESQNKSGESSSSKVVPSIISVSQKSEKNKRCTSHDGSRSRVNSNSPSHDKHSKKRSSSSTTPERSNKKDIKLLTFEKQPSTVAGQMNGMEIKNKDRKESLSESTSKDNAYPRSEASIDSKSKSNIPSKEKSKTATNSKMRKQESDEQEEEQTSENTSESSNGTDFTDTSTTSTNDENVSKLESNCQENGKGHYSTGQDANKELKSRASKRHSRSEEPPAKRCKETVKDNYEMNNSVSKTHMHCRGKSTSVTNKMGKHLGHQGFKGRLCSDCAREEKLESISRHSGSHEKKCVKDSDSDHSTENSTYHQGRGGRLFKRRPFRGGKYAQDKPGSSSTEFCTFVDSSKTGSINSSRRHAKHSSARAVLDNLFGLQIKNNTDSENIKRSKSNESKNANNGDTIHTPIGKRRLQDAKLVGPSKKQSDGDINTICGDKEQSRKNEKGGNKSKECSVSQLHIKLETDPTTAETVQEKPENVFQSLDSSHKEEIATVKWCSPVLSEPSSKLDIKKDFQSPVSPIMMNCIDKETSSSIHIDKIEGMGQNQTFLDMTDSGVDVKLFCEADENEELIYMNGDFAGIEDENFSCIEEEIVCISNENIDSCLTDHNYVCGFETASEATQAVDIVYEVEVAMPMDASIVEDLFDVGSIELVNVDKRPENSSSNWDEIQSHEIPVDESNEYLITNTVLPFLQEQSENQQDRNEAANDTDNDTIFESNSTDASDYTRNNNIKDTSNNNRSIIKMEYSVPEHIDLDKASDDNPSHLSQSIYENLSDEVLELCNCNDPRLRCLKTRTGGARDLKLKNKDVSTDRKQIASVTSSREIPDQSLPLLNDPISEDFTDDSISSNCTGRDTLTQSENTDQSSGNLDQGKTNWECQNLSYHSLPRKRLPESSKIKPLPLFPRWPSLSNPLISSRLSKQQTMDILDEFCNIVRPLSPLPEEDGDCLRKISCKSPVQFTGSGCVSSTMCTHAVNMSASCAVVKGMKHMGACSVSVPCASAIQYEVCGITVVQLFGTPPDLQLQPVPDSKVQDGVPKNNNEKEIKTIRNVGSFENGNSDISISDGRQRKNICELKGDTCKDGILQYQHYYQPNTLVKLCIYSLKKHPDFHFSNVNVHQINPTLRATQKCNTESDQGGPKEVDSAFIRTSFKDACSGNPLVSLKRKTSECNFEIGEESGNRTKTAKYLENHGTAKCFPNASHYNQNNCSGNDDKDMKSKEQYDPKQQKSYTLPDYNTEMDSFQCDDMSTPIVLSASDRVYHINGGAHKKPLSWLEESSQPQKLTIQAGYHEDEHQFHSLDIEDCSEHLDSSDDLLSQAMESAGLSDLAIDSFLRSDFNIESFIMNSEDTVDSVCDETDDNAFLDSIFSVVDRSNIDVPGCESMLRSSEPERDTAPNITLSLQPSMMQPSCSGVQAFNLKSPATAHQFKSTFNPEGEIGLPGQDFRNQIRMDVNSWELSCPQDRCRDNNPSTSYFCDQYNFTDQTSSNLLSFGNISADYNNGTYCEANHMQENPNSYNLTELRRLAYVNDKTYTSDDQSDVSFTSDSEQINEALFFMPDTEDSHSRLTTDEHQRETCAGQEFKDTPETDSSDSNKEYPKMVPKSTVKSPVGGRRRELALACLERDVDPYTRASLRRRALPYENRNKISLLEAKKTRKTTMPTVFQARSLVCIERSGNEKRGRVRQPLKKMRSRTDEAKPASKDTVMKTNDLATTHCRRMSSRILAKRKEKQSQTEQLGCGSSKSKKKKAVHEDKVTATTTLSLGTKDASENQTPGSRNSDGIDDHHSEESKTLSSYLEKQEASVAMFTRQLSASSPGLFKNRCRPVKWDTYTKVSQISTKRKCPLRLSKKKGQLKDPAVPHAEITQQMEITDDLNRNNNAGADKTNANPTLDGVQKQKTKPSIHLQRLQSKKPELLPRVGSDMENYKEVQRKLKQVHSRLVKKHGKQYNPPSTSCISSFLSGDMSARSHSKSTLNSSLSPQSALSQNSIALDSSIGVLPTIASAIKESSPQSLQRRADIVLNGPAPGSLLAKQPESMIRFVTRMSTSYGEQLAKGDVNTKRRLNRVCDHYLSSKGNKMRNKVQSAPATRTARLLDRVSSSSLSKPKSATIHTRAGGDSTGDTKLKTDCTPKPQLLNGRISTVDQADDGSASKTFENIFTSDKNDDALEAQDTRTIEDSISETVNANSTDIGQMPQTCTEKYVSLSKKKIPRLKKPPQISSKPLRPDLVSSVNRLAARPPSPSVRLRYKVQNWEREFGKSLLAADSNPWTNQMRISATERHRDRSRKTSDQQATETKSRLLSRPQLERKSYPKAPLVDKETHANSEVLIEMEDASAHDNINTAASTGAELESTLSEIRNYIRLNANSKIDLSSELNKSDEEVNDLQKRTVTPHLERSVTSPRNTDVYNDSIKLTPMDNLKQLADDIVRVHSPLNFPNLLDASREKDLEPSVYPDSLDSSQSCQIKKSSRNQSPARRRAGNVSSQDMAHSSSGRVRLEDEDQSDLKTSGAATRNFSCRSNWDGDDDNRTSRESRSHTGDRRDHIIDRSDINESPDGYQVGEGRSAMRDDIMNLVKAGESVTGEETMSWREDHEENLESSERIVKLPDLKQMARSTALRGGVGQEFVKDDFKDFNLETVSEDDLRRYFSDCNENKQVTNTPTSGSKSYDGDLRKSMPGFPPLKNATTAEERTVKLPPIKNASKDICANMSYNHELGREEEPHRYMRHCTESNTGEGQYRHDTGTLPDENNRKTPTDTDSLQPLESLTSLKVSLDKDFRETFKDIPSLGTYYGSYERNSDVNSNNPLEDSDYSGDWTTGSHGLKMDLRVCKMLSPIKEMNESEENLSGEDR